MQALIRNCVSHVHAPQEAGGAVCMAISVPLGVVLTTRPGNPGLSYRRAVPTHPVSIIGQVHPGPSHRRAVPAVPVTIRGPGNPGGDYTIEAMGNNQFTWITNHTSCGCRDPNKTFSLDATTPNALEPLERDLTGPRTTLSRVRVQRIELGTQHATGWGPFCERGLKTDEASARA